MSCSTRGILSWHRFHEQFSDVFEPVVDEIDLATIELSCHFALELTLLQGRCSRFRMSLHRAPLPVVSVSCDTAPLPFL